MSVQMFCTKYASFLLRVSCTCQAHLDSPSPWETEIEVEHIQSGQHWTCSSWPELLEFLTQEVEGLEQMKWEETYPEG